MEETLQVLNQTRTRVIKAEHLMAIMLQTGRLKDLARLSQFVESGNFDHAELETVLVRHGLLQKWKEFVSNA